jgi:hypothetical protein
VRIARTHTQAKSSARLFRMCFVACGIHHPRRNDASVSATRITVAMLQPRRQTPLRSPPAAEVIRSNHPTPRSFGARSCSSVRRTKQTTKAP